VDTLTLALPGLAGLVLLTFVLTQARIALAFHRTRMLPPEGQPLFDDTPLPEPLSACEAAALAELEALGFAQAAQWRERHGDEPVRSLFLATADARAFALLRLRGSSLYGYPVSFFSFDGDGRVLQTINRTAWILAGCRDSSELIDARVDSVAEQWTTHSTRMGGACAIEPAQAQRRIRDQALADALAALESGVWVRGQRGAHMSLRSAVRVTLALRRERSVLGRPFSSPCVTGPLVPSFLGDLLAMHERAAARQKEGIGTLKSLVLLGSLLLGLWVWGIAFDWRTAVLLVAVLLVHESGHALAMRLFGWSDMHMFFVPLMGAVVTGRRPRSVPAWKEAVVLLAGPLPGLLAGLAVLAAPVAVAPLLRSAAIMAVIVNAFNLLPLMPLDGGRLVELALFNRWPRGRVLLLGASAAGLIAAGVTLKGPASTALGLLLMLSLRRQWQMAALERAVLADDAGPEHALPWRVARVVHERSGVASLPAKLMLAVGVLARRRISAARAIESVAIVLLLVALWALAAVPLSRTLASGGRLRHPGPPARTAAQKAFDDTWFAADDQPTATQWTVLLAREAALRPDDPRHRDVEWLRIPTGPAASRREGVDRWLAQPGDGHFENHNRVLWHEFDARFGEARVMPPARRPAELSALVSWVDGFKPRALPAAIEARLRLAEAIDLAGDTPGALRLLDETADFSAQARHGHGGGPTPAVIRARAWFDIAHGHPDAALQRLEAASPALAKGAPDDDLAVDHAWARLFAGQSEPAYIEMRAAMHADPHAPGAPAHDDEDFDADDAMDLAVAQARAGQVEAARALAQGAGRSGCEQDARLVDRDTVLMGPWQVPRLRERAKLARAWCARVPSDGGAASGTAR
jgi:Zn-dependent protease